MKKIEDAILDAARSKFDRFGFKKTTVDEIAREARISKRTIYEHFKDKEDLFVSLFMKDDALEVKALEARTRINRP
jgi:AcrR family transcriptional regulator